MDTLVERMKNRNPYGSPEEGVETVLDTGVFLTKKVHHVFEGGARVVVHAPGHATDGHAGKIVDDRNDNRLRVKLDSGHEIHASTEDLIPEAMAPAAENFKILKRALDAGAVPVHDRVAIETAFEKISTRSY